MRLDRLDPRTRYDLERIAERCRVVILGDGQPLMVPQRLWQQAKAVAVCVAVRLHPELSVETIGDVFGVSGHPGAQNLVARNEVLLGDEIERIARELADDRRTPVDPARVVR